MSERTYTKDEIREAVQLYLGKCPDNIFQYLDKDTPPEPNFVQKYVQVANQYILGSTGCETYSERQGELIQIEIERQIDELRREFLGAK